MTTKQKTSEAAQPQVICGGCGYDLQGLADDAKCPECGSTERVWPKDYPSRLLYRWAVGAWAVAAGGWLYGGTIIVLTGSSRYFNHIAFLIASYVMLAGLLHWLVRDRKALRRYHFIGLALLVLALTSGAMPWAVIHFFKTTTIVLLLIFGTLMLQVPRKHRRRNLILTITENAWLLVWVMFLLWTIFQEFLNLRPSLDAEQARISLAWPIVDWTTYLLVLSSIACCGGIYLHLKLIRLTTRLQLRRMRVLLYISVIAFVPMFLLEVNFRMPGLFPRITQWHVQVLNFFQYFKQNFYGGSLFKVSESDLLSMLFSLYSRTISCIALLIVFIAFLVARKAKTSEVI